MSKVYSSGATVRSRVLAGILAMFLVVVSATGLMLYYLLHNQILTSVDESLKRTTHEYSLRINEPVSPKTGEPYKDATTFLYDVMQNTVAAPHEGFIATVDRSLKWTAPENVQLRLEDDKQFLDWATSIELTEAVYLRTVTTDAATYRAVVLPANINDENTNGRYTVAFDLDAEIADLRSVFVPYIWVSIGALALASLVAWFFTGRLLNPLSALRETAMSVSEKDLTQRIDVKAKGDLKDLTHSFNSMLDRVETAVTANRQLLDDVGHELRTPVTIVRGYLEVVDTQNPSDVQETRDIALEELDRMSILIDDLLMLAKSEKNDFVRLEPVDLNDFMERTFTKAKLLGDRSWSLTLGNDRVVDIDPQRFTQAILQLSENAVKYSEEGTAVHILVDTEQAHTTRISVTDQGIGIPESELDRVFERFQRGSNSARAQGSGLGLAITTAIIAAHGGSASVTSTPSEGSTFTIEIPHSAQPPISRA